MEDRCAGPVAGKPVLSKEDPEAMGEDKRSNSRQDEGSGRKPYRKPELTVHGTVASLTRGNDKGTDEPNDPTKGKGQS